jgi:hypothetical protein
VEGSCSLRETRGVRRRRSIEEWSSSEGTHRKGADGGDAQRGPAQGRGSGGGKTGEVHAWAMGTGVRHSGVDGRGERRAGEEKGWPAVGGSI